MKKFTILLLILSLIFTPILSSAQEITYQDAPYEDTTVYARIASYFKITIPKTVVLKGNPGALSQAHYTVSVSGDIAGTEEIEIVPEENFDLFTINKNKETASVSQPKTKWTYQTLSEDATGLISAPLSAGSWSGVFYFNIKLNTNSLITNKTQFEIAQNQTDKIFVYFNNEDITDKCTFTAQNENISLNENTITAHTIGKSVIDINYTFNNTPYTTQVEVNVVDCVHILENTSYVDPTCTQDGFTEEKCTLCNKTFTTTLEKLGHKYKIVQDKSSTCEEEGEIIQVCEVCDDTLIIKSSSLGHVYSLSNRITDFQSTCTTHGQSSVHCEVCNEAVKETIINLPLLPHTFTTYTSNNDATCTRDGTKTAICDVCHEAYDIITDPNTRLNHPYTEEHIQPTCIAQGYTKYFCETCGDSIDHIIPALGHTYENGICIRCGKSDLSTFAPGIYDDSRNLIKSWDELLSEGTVHLDANGAFTTNIRRLENGMPTAGNDSSDALSGTLVLPPTVKTIKANALAYLENLVCVYIPESTTTIESGAIKSNPKLEAINIDATNKNFVVEDDILFNKDKTVLIYCPPLHEGDVYEIPSTVHTLYAGAFSYSALSHIIVPPSVKQIDAQCFQNSQIKEMDLSKNTSLTQLGLVHNFNADPTYFYYGIFENCQQLTSVRLPESLKTIGEAAFKDCPLLTNINIPQSIETIGRYAFYKSPAVLELNLPKLRRLGNYAFNSSALKSLKTSSALTELENISVFASSSIEEIDLSESVSLTRLGATILEDTYDTVQQGLFGGCTHLRTAILPNTVKIIGDNTFYNNTSLTTLEGLDSVELIGYHAIRKCGEIGDIVLPSIKRIGMYSFTETKLTSITAGSALEEIMPTSAFRACPNLVKVDLSQTNLKSLDDSYYTVSTNTGSYYGTFQDCPALTTVLLPETLTYIGDSTFRNCAALTSINIPSALTFIGRYTFYKVPASIEVSLPNIKNIGNRAFAESGILSITTGSQLQDIEIMTFYKAQSLKMADFSSSTLLKSIGATFLVSQPESTLRNYGNFEDCVSLTTVILPEGIEELNDSLFYNTALTSINIPQSVKMIGKYTFYNQKIQGDINIPNIERIGTYAFYNTDITSFTANGKLEFIDKGVFIGCLKLTSAILSPSVETYKISTSKTDLSEAQPLVIRAGSNVKTELTTTQANNFWFKQ